MPEKIPAAQSEISLSQAILAPLNSLFKAQIHAGRSYLSYLLQMGYPHVNINKDGIVDEESLKKTDSLYSQKFRFDRNTDGKKETFEICIPTLALIPVSPLAIDEADFEFDFSVNKVDRHQQIQESEEESLKKDEKYDKFNRPWYLVKDPVSFKGGLAPESKAEAESSSSSTIKVKVKVSKQSLPSGLDKLLTTLNQISEIRPIEKTNP